MKRDRQALSQFFEDWVDGEMTSTVANMFLGGPEDTYVVKCKLSPLSPVFSVDDIDRARESGAKWVAFIAPVAVNNRLSNNGEYINSVDSAELYPGVLKLAFVVSVMRIGSSLGFNSYRYDDGVSPSGTIRRRLSVMNLYDKRKKSFNNLGDSYVAEALYDHEKQLTYPIQGIPEMFNSAYMLYGSRGIIGIPLITPSLSSCLVCIVMMLCLHSTPWARIVCGISLIWLLSVSVVS